MTKEELTARVAARYDEIKKLHDHDNFYDYEKEFERIWIELGREVLEKSLGDVPEERRKKKDSRPDSAP
jgi:hypothetical protein